MAYSFVFTKSADKDLENLSKTVAIRVLKKIREYCGLKNPLLKAKKLKGFQHDTYRFRVGDYRIIFRIDEKTGVIAVLVVLRVLHRRHVYEKI